MNSKKLRALREERGMTRRQVEDATGISQGRIWSLETNEGVSPNLATAKKLADCYGVTVDELIAD